MVSNCENRPRASKPYRAVQLRRWGKWVSEIRSGKGSRIWLGSYFTPEAAARAYDTALLCLRGSDSSHFNFPDSAHAPPLSIDFPTFNPSPNSIRRAAAAVGSAFDTVPPPPALKDISSHHNVNRQVDSPDLAEVEARDESFLPTCSVAEPLRGVEGGKEGMEVQDIDELDNLIDFGLVPPFPAGFLDEDPLGFLADVPPLDNKRDESIS